MFSYLNSQLIQLLVSVPAVLLCLSVHEACHGYMAYALGDPTAKHAGRLTLDPIRHLDPIGTICLLFFHVGWAKPVPVNPGNFKHPRRDIALVSLAGPVSNFLLALVALFLYYPLRLAESSIVMTIALMLYMVAVMSIGLGVFNLIPVPPLDGSKILLSFLPRKYEWKFAQYQQYIQFGLLILLVLGVLNTPIRFFVNIIYQGLASIVLAVLG
ncbi:site-2 protease family protein [Butyricicoccus sp.]|uniref:site-2 protease family protein n=1 Tax=Butyricicoccus sp. TaxID=2049021 RepID=UPI002A8EA5B8|nr:site-2 protease family protein [Butyricicoccus sp.]